MELPKNYYQKYEFAQLSTFCSLSYIGFTASEDTTVHFGVDCILQQQVPGLKHTNANIVEQDQQGSSNEGFLSKWGEY